MYMDKSKYTYNRNQQGNNRKSWPRMNPRQHWRPNNMTDCDGDTQMRGSSSSGRPYRGRGKARFNPGYQGQYKPNRNKGSWWKIVVYDADKFDKTEFFKMLDNTTNENIDPQGVHIERQKLIFFIKNPRAKDAIKKQSGKLTVKDHTISMFAVQSGGPQSILSKDQIKEKVCNALFKRYTDNCLRLSEFHRDADLKGMRSRLFELGDVLGELIEEKCAGLLHEIDFTNNNLYSTHCLRNILAACKSLVRVKLDKNNINKVAELYGLKEYAPNITHLSLIDNPIKNLMDEAQYLSDIRKLFPKLIHLDNVLLPEKVQFDLEDNESLPETKKFCILLEPALKSGLQNFFLQFVKIHDSEDIQQRTMLGLAYDETALFSLASSWRSKGDIQDKFPSKLPADVAKRNRNFRLYSRAELKESRLFVGRESIIKELCEMAPTQHMLTTINIDTSPVSTNCFTAVLTGILDCPDSYRTFTRTFILTMNPANMSFLILNDQMSIARSNPEVVKKLQKPPDLTPAAGPPDQNALIQRIQAATKMTVVFCKLCLEATNWNLEQALLVFQEKKNMGQIPANAFM